MSLDNNQGDAMYTPRRVQKCLFGLDGGSKKKVTPKIRIDKRRSDNSSGEESDLGPISPLALSDRTPSSCDSSQRSHPNSPLAASDKSSLAHNLQFSCNHATSGLTMDNLRNHRSSFSALKKLTRAARYSPQQKTLLSSPKHLVRTPLKHSLDPPTPRQLNVALISNQQILDNPQRHFGREVQNEIADTPCKSGHTEYKLITPLGSESKMVPLPKLHKRKSVCTFDSITDHSPERKENKLKRHMPEVIENSGSKFLKLDEDSTIPKARAALFLEKTCETKFKDFTLSAERFYNSCDKRKSYQSMRDLADRAKRRRSAPVQSTTNRRYLKKHRLGQINAGVSHGIRKLKPKPNLQVSKKEISDILQNNVPKHLSDTKAHKSSSTEMSVVTPIGSPIFTPNVSLSSAQESPPPEIDPNRRFFKTRRPVKRYHIIPTTNNMAVNNKIKKKVDDSHKTGLSNDNTQSVNHVHKRAKLDGSPVDATDLTVDEPEIEASLEQSEVANILKILEEDWADDEYDTMEMLPTQSLQNVLSPVKTVTMLQDVTLSPASELSNMTSTINIQDVVEAPASNEVSLNITGSNNTTPSTKKCYPLFNKGFSVNKNLEKTDSKKTNNNTKENTNWQLSVRRRGGENQYQLDAGQKRFGATQCAECGIVYQLGEPEDENAHLNYHNSINILKFRGWKTERIIMEDPFTSSRIILIEPDDLKQCWNKVSNILEVVDRDLGLVEGTLSEYQQKKVYLYIRNKTVLGVLVAEYIETAHRMIPELLDLNCCTAESTPAKCGINVVWTAMSHRRQGIATKMIDVLRAQFYYGYVMSLDDIAFSTPTTGGKIFAEKYTKTRNFKVYS